MARTARNEPPHPGADSALDNSSITAARLVAFAITMLLVSFLVIDRSVAALEAGASAPSSELRAGSVSLSDDDGGRTLVDLDDLFPGRPRQNCITVDYAGSAFDGGVELAARGGGLLAPYLDAEIIVGTGGQFGDCTGFEAESTLFEGTLKELVAQHGADGEALAAFPIRAARESRTFQITFTLRDQSEAQGLEGTVDFLWSVHT